MLRDLSKLPLLVVALLLVPTLSLPARQNINEPPLPEAENRGNAGLNVEKFSGMCYGPHRDNENPDCGIQPTPDEIAEDLLFISSLTNAIRTYSAADNLEQIPVLCEQQGVDCYPCAWLSTYPCENEKQVSGLIEIAELELEHVKALIVGNEVLLRDDLSEAELIAYVNRVKEVTDLPVGSAETWSHWLGHPQLAEAVDLIFVHIYGYWDGVSIDDAADYAFEKWNEVREAYPDKRIVIGETGWPSAGETRGEAIPTAENQAQYLSDFVAMANSHGIEYFYFEIFDEKWKSGQNEGQTGAHWGLYESTGSIKPLLIDLVPDAAQGGLERPARVVAPKKAGLPLYVYTDACDPRNAFYPSGWMGALEDFGQGDSLPADPTDVIDIYCQDNPHSGETCIRLTYDPPFGQWAGIYWQYPVNNWGYYPGYDLSDSVDADATVRLRFYARGQHGGEEIEFKSGGITGFEYEDSYGPLVLGTFGYAFLTDDWQQYEIELSGQDLSMVIGGFAWIVHCYYFSPVDTIYLDDIVILDVTDSCTAKQGTISGETWDVNGSPYCVVGDIQVADLAILPGVTVQFREDYTFEVSGTLKAVGSELDSITFKSERLDRNWGGILMDQIVPGSELAYCTITGSTNRGLTVINSPGTTIRSCAIVDNSMSSSTANGAAEAKGGGVYVEGPLAMSDCLVARNYAYTTAELGSSYCLGGGIYVCGDLTLSGCTIENNIADSWGFGGSGHGNGGGVYAVGGLQLLACIINNNYADGNGYEGG
ncbi:MAG: glycosyl hydrolase family 17 protein, partial [bacterium]